jgi:glycylpeptide N-tetradecanoyltransferase
LEIHHNKAFLEELKFGPGDGHLKYYLYNWLTKPMEPQEVGLVLL